MYNVEQCVLYSVLDTMWYSVYHVIQYVQCGTMYSVAQFVPCRLQGLWYDLANPFLCIVLRIRLMV